MKITIQSYLELEKIYSKSKDGCIYEYEDMPGKIWCFKAGSEPTKCLDSGNITELRKNVVFI